jgi:pimeloyl-ACP methyl ester carboxylesterase
MIRNLIAVALATGIALACSSDSTSPDVVNKPGSGTGSAGPNGGSVTLASGTSATIAPGELSGSASLHLSESGSDTGEKLVHVELSGSGEDSATVTVRVSLDRPPLSPDSVLLGRVERSGDPAGSGYWTSFTVAPSAISGEKQAAQMAGVGASKITVQTHFTVAYSADATLRIAAAPSSQDANSCSDVYQFEPMPGTFPKSDAPLTVILIHGWQLARWCSGSGSPQSLGLAAMVDYHPEVDWAALSADIRVAYPAANIFYVRYPTTLAPSEAGRYLEEKLGNAFNVVLVGHSMGGLVARWTAHYDAQSGSHRIAGLITLGTPHNGTPAASTDIGGALTYMLPSDGTSSLRTERTDLRAPLPVPAGVPLLAIAGGVPCNRSPGASFDLIHKRVFCSQSFIPGTGQYTSDVFDDGIVPTNSALPTYATERLQLDLPSAGISHTDLMSSSTARAAVVTMLGRFASTGTDDEPPTDGLVAYYPLDGNGIDASGNANDGAASGVTAVSNRNGIAGKASEFRNGAAITVPSNTALKNLTSEMTLGVWIKTSSGSSLGSGVIPVSRREPSNRIHFLVYVESVNGASLQCCSAGGSESGTFYSPSSSTYSTLNDGRWHHFAVTRKYGVNGFTRLYLDGVMISGKYLNGSATASAAVMDAALLIGKQASGSDGRFTGQLDELRIYNRILSDSEIGLIAH